MATMSDGIGVQLKTANGRAKVGTSQDLIHFFSLCTIQGGGLLYIFFTKNPRPLVAHGGVGHALSVLVYLRVYGFCGALVASTMEGDVHLLSPYGTRVLLDFRVRCVDVFCNAKVFEPIRRCDTCFHCRYYSMNTNNTKPKSTSKLSLLLLSHEIGLRSKCFDLGFALVLKMDLRPIL